MSTVDFLQAEPEQLITHHVGNKLRDENIKLSTELSVIESESRDYLLSYFLHRVKTDEWFSFTHAVEPEMNEVYSIVATLFENPEIFITASQNFARLLYEQSTHPKINEGELNVVYFSNMILDNEAVDAIGIFKSETNAPFIKMNAAKNKYNITHDVGFELSGMDKGCIVFNTSKEDGYRLLIVDTVNRATETQYWRTDFLNVKPVKDEFHQTHQFMSIAKDFVTKQIPHEFEVSKADRIDLLNRSVDYFKTHDSFDKTEFEHEVFQNESLINSFRSFDKEYRGSNAVDLADNFEISTQAVKKQARVFKSVLKLDKNFHVYIHGDRSLIQQGVESDGRKFYKIYFEEEM